ncbi:hypothetical protein N9599_00030 [Candidatus Pelagibacter sp.]|nr:hypothetical protein [Candidatus Pelagibacter sp.]
MNVIYIGLTNSFAFNEVHHLRKNFSLIPKHIIHTIDKNELIKFEKIGTTTQLLSDSTILKNNNLIFDKEFKINNGLLKFIESYRHIIEPMFKKFEYSSNAFSKKEIDDYIYECVAYWFNFIKNKRINLIFHLESPHRIFDFIIYLIAKYLKIPNLWFRDPNLDGKYLIEWDYFKSPSNLRETYIKKIKQKIRHKKNINNKLNKKYVNFIKKEQIFFNPNKITIRNKPNFKGKIGFFKFYFDYLFSYKHPITNSEFKQIKIKNRNFNCKIIGFNYLFWSFTNILKTLIIKIYYKLISHKGIIKKNFCIYYMSYQPEATSYPDAWDMHDQSKNIDLLIKNIPKDYQLAIKEHPTQLNLTSSFFYKNPQIRQIKFYRKISDKYKDRVIFLDEKFDFNTSKNTPKFTATINGTIGLESVIKGIPAIIFGHAWYQGCEGTFCIRNIKDLKKLFISNKFKTVNKKKVNFFIDLAHNLALPFYYKDIQKRYYPQYKKLTKKQKLTNLKKLFNLGLRSMSKKN